jgi:hypothetical protein
VAGGGRHALQPGPSGDDDHQVAFEAFLGQGPVQARPGRWRRFTVVLSLGLHGALLLAAVAFSFWRVEEITPAGVSVSFLGSPRPAPPPPPAAREKAVVPRPRSRVARADHPRVEALVEPRTREAEPPAKEEPGNTEEPRAVGVTAGVPGATGGGPVATLDPELPRPAPPPPPAAHDPAPVSVLPGVGSAQRITDITDSRFRPSLPGPLNRAGMMVWGIFRICVGVDGSVAQVRALKSTEPMVDAEWFAVIRLWQYRPLAIGGHAVPFCHTMRLEVRGAS